MASTKGKRETPSNKQRQVEKRKIIAGEHTEDGPGVETKKQLLTNVLDKFAALSADLSQREQGEQNER